MEWIILIGKPQQSNLNEKGEDDFVPDRLLAGKVVLRSNCVQVVPPDEGAVAASGREECGLPPESFAFHGYFTRSAD